MFWKSRLLTGALPPTPEPHPTHSNGHVVFLSTSGSRSQAANEFPGTGRITEWPALQTQRERRSRLLIPTRAKRASTRGPATPERELSHSGYSDNSMLKLSICFADVLVDEEKIKNIDRSASSACAAVKPRQNPKGHGRHGIHLPSDHSRHRIGQNFFAPFSGPAHSDSNRGGCRVADERPDGKAAARSP